jgi:hypothetical protein
MIDYQRDLIDADVEPEIGSAVPTLQSLVEAAFRSADPIGGRIDGCETRFDRNTCRSDPGRGAAGQPK